MALNAHAGRRPRQPKAPPRRTRERWAVHRRRSHAETMWRTALCSREWSAIRAGFALPRDAGLETGAPNAKPASMALNPHAGRRPRQPKAPPRRTRERWAVHRRRSHAETTWRTALCSREWSAIRAGFALPRDAGVDAGAPRRSRGTGAGGSQRGLGACCCVHRGRFRPTGRCRRGRRRSEALQGSRGWRESARAWRVLLRSSRQVSPYRAMPAWTPAFRTGDSGPEAGALNGRCRRGGRRSDGRGGFDGRCGACSWMVAEWSAMGAGFALTGDAGVDAGAPSPTRACGCAGTGATARPS